MNDVDWLDLKKCVRTQVARTSEAKETFKRAKRLALKKEGGKVGCISFFK